MKTILKKSLILVLIMIAAIVMAKEGLAAVIDRTASITASGTKVEDIDQTSPILDDFNDNGLVNHWGDQTGGFSVNGSFGTSNSTNSPYDGLICLRLDYDVNTSGSFAGYYSRLESKDISAYTHISFWVKGASGGEFFKIELNNNSANADRNSAAIYITDYLDGGLTTSWRQVAIPLHNFVNLDGTTSMKEFIITFENYQGSVNESPLTGTIYIDRIEFLSTPANIVRIDHYGDKLGISTLGGNIGDMPNSGSDPSPIKPWAKYSFPASQYHNYPNVFLSEYDVTHPYGWSGHYFIFGGGNIDTDPDPNKNNAGWKPYSHNFSGYNYLKLYVKARSSTENPKRLKVELVDNSLPASAVRLGGITTSWQLYSIPLSVFSGLDKATIKQLNFVYEAGDIFDNGGSKVGALYIDEVEFTK